MAIDMEPALTHLSIAERAAVQRYLALLHERLADDLLEVWLFGSAARGDMWQVHMPMRSDIDLLILTGAEVAAHVKEQLVNDTYPLFLECGRQISPAFRAAAPFLTAPEPRIQELRQRLQAEGRCLWCVSARPRLTGAVTPSIDLDERRTARLLLTRMCAADLDDLVRMHRDPRVMATLGGVRSEAETRQGLDRLLAHWEEHGFGWWVVRELATGRFAGRGGLRHVIVGGKPEVEVGYGFLPEFWSGGLATELARESVRVGFTLLRRPDLVSFTLTTNRASQRVMEKAGFRYERDIVHADLPHVLYRLTAAEWRAGAST